MGFPAKYATVCARCAVKIAVGEMIAKDPTRPGKWAHESCPVEQGGLFDAGPQEVAGPGQRTVVYTDGACSGNPGPGGWAWAVPQGGPQGSGAATATTNQRMEIQAALEAVRALDGPLTVVSDSTYVVNCFRDGWWRGWLARGWVNSAKKPVANRDLWEPLIDLVRDRDVRFQWVKGHSGDEMNDLVDALAVQAAKSAAVASK